MTNFIARLIINALGLYVASIVVPGILLDGLEAVLFAALIFGFVNALIRPFVMFFTCLINLLTLGLFTLIVNGAMLLVTSWAAQQLNLAFRVDDFVSAFLGAIIISIVSFIVTKALR